MSVWASVEKPAHVPAQLLVDFDFMRPGTQGRDPCKARSRPHGLTRLPLRWSV
jgi:hypothetical protein